jgi:hypothetical protein
MQLMSSILFMVAMLGTVLIGAAGHAGELRQPAGRVALTIDSTVPAGGGFGMTWHKGILTLLDGSKHTFAVSGLGIQGSEGSLVDLEAKGEVYQLQKVEDLAGTYRRTVGEIVPEHGTQTVMIENQHGVIIAVTVTLDKAKGHVRLVPSEAGVAVSLER